MLINAGSMSDGGKCGSGKHRFDCPGCRLRADMRRNAETEAVVGNSVEAYAARKSRYEHIHAVGDEAAQCRLVVGVKQWGGAQRRHGAECRRGIDALQYVVE